MWCYSYFFVYLRQHLLRAFLLLPLHTKPQGRPDSHGIEAGRRARYAAPERAVPSIPILSNNGG